LFNVGGLGAAEAFTQIYTSIKHTHAI